MKKEYKFYVYISTNVSHKVLYTGITNNIERRNKEHKTNTNTSSFTAKYNINKIIYYELYKYIDRAIEREKQIKAGSRNGKIKLINSINPKWEDLIDVYH